MKLSMLTALVIASFLAPDLRAELAWSDGSLERETDKTIAYDVFRATGPGTLAQVPKEETKGRTSSGSAYRYTASLITTCTGLVNNYPKNAVNYFFQDKHEAVFYFAYILVSPPHDGSHLVVNEWYDPDGRLICSLERQAEISLQDNFISLGGDSSLYYLFVNSIGIKELLADNGQLQLPIQDGLYHIKLSISGQTVGTTFFRIIKGGGGGKPLEKLGEVRGFLKDRNQGK
jgi:hypothetical protein